MADLEDLAVTAASVSAAARRAKARPGFVVPRHDRSRREQAEGDSFIPGSKTIFLRTWGCSHNNSDGEYMAGLLSAAGYTISDKREGADLWILNSCTVKTPSEDTFNNEIRDARSRNIPVVLAGCVPQTMQIDRVVEVVEETLQGRTVRLLGSKKVDGRKTGGTALDLPKIRRNPLIEIIPINTGCLNKCTYCKTKHARGDLGSYTIQEIVQRVQQVIAEGVVEIWLTSEDTGAYGRDINTSIPELLRAILAVVPAGVMVRLGMTNPPYIVEHVQAIAECLRHPRMYKFIHIPIQSGANPILHAMQREYTREDFCFVADTLLEQVPALTIATDIICGFPGETDADFEDTFEIVRRYHFPSLFTNQFFPRPGTPAAAMERVDPRLVKQRTKELSDYFRGYRVYDDQLDSYQRVLVTDTATDNVHFVAHNRSFDQVLVPANPDFMGKLIVVKITNVNKFFIVRARSPSS
ncbi:uncharacterized protein MONBRDRAFT_10557 [Monosiga brevicollis MX1]|uniref:Threonylcarbamoyladenosine tRNA methylthiotransferase n=1 Tax=Monosiga brevicollis TaxID=81824 RepID=A9V6Q8_MONBE|nr:uncharacterized protein MONBRDRAFT_10557 [Monosiga brevicollis MX1]EDQ86849.1 predicted protein [Monosiga brevicollis MX1]|eukprot:XP_001748394.1 hypothetical protein [Monosiga brevicollis MX1]